MGTKAAQATEEEVITSEIDDDAVVDGEVEEEEVITPNAEEEEDPAPGGDDSKPEDEPDEVVLTIGDDEPPSDEPDEAPEWVKELRKAHRQTQKENRELKERLKSIESPKPKVQLGPKPKLEDFDYDTDEFESAYEKWQKQKREVEQQEEEAQAAQKAEEEAWQARLQAYGEAKTTLKVKDFDEAEAAVLSALDQTQQGIVVQGADNAAHVFYVLGKNDSRLKELSSIKDPVKFAFAVAKLEKDIKVKPRKAPATQPEKTVTGTGPKSGTVDSTLEALRAEAAKTGDYSKVMQYKRNRRK